MGRPKGTQGVACICKTCGAEFREWPYRLAQNGGQYCGPKCMSIDHTVTSWCLNCDKRLSIPKSSSRHPLGQRYCSVECRAEGARKRVPERFWAKVLKTDTCWLWQGRHTAFGYGEFSLRPDQPIGAHRMAWQLTIGPIPAGLYVCHTCDNPPCVRPEHLYLGTPRDNWHDVFARGRDNTARGIRAGAAKLTDSRVLEIRQRRASEGLSYKALAAQYGVSPGCITSVCLRRTWRHVP